MQFLMVGRLEVQREGESVPEECLFLGLRDTKLRPHVAFLSYNFSLSFEKVQLGGLTALCFITKLLRTTWKVSHIDF